MADMDRRGLLNLGGGVGLADRLQQIVWGG